MGVNIKLNINPGVATPLNPAILLDRDDILMRHYSVHRTGLSTVQILMLPGKNYSGLHCGEIF